MRTKSVDATDPVFAQQRFVGDGGTDLVADVGGDSAQPTVILLHGGGQTRHSWGGAMGALVHAGYHVVNVDSRGHGESGWSSNGHYSLSVRSRDLQAILKRIQGPYALVGASMGGSTAMYTACTAPSKDIAALILVDIVPNPSAKGIARIKDFMRKHLDGFASVDEAIAAVAAYNPERSRRPDPSGMRKNLREQPDGRFKWHWDPRILTLDATTESAALREALSANSRRHAIPTLLIRGLRSDVVADDGIAELRRQLPALEVFDVPDAGHMVAGDRNDAFIAGILQYLQRHLPLTGNTAASCIE